MSEEEQVRRKTVIHLGTSPSVQHVCLLMIVKFHLQIALQQKMFAEARAQAVGLEL